MSRGYMCLDMEKQLGDLTTIGKRLNLKKVLDGENGSCRYDQMKPDFLADIFRMTGSQTGMTKDDDCYEFWLNGSDMISFLIVRFSRVNGYYMGPRFVATRRRPKGSGILVGAREYKERRTDEVNTIIVQFAEKATQLGYLV